jgi:exodeoxyribonuclease VII small subunit
MKFEEKLKAIENIINNLENEKFLDKATEHYEKGILYITECEKELQSTESKIEKIIKKKNNEIILEQVSESDYS